MNETTFKHPPLLNVTLVTKDELVACVLNSTQVKYIKQWTRQEILDRWATLSKTGEYDCYMRCIHRHSVASKGYQGYVVYGDTMNDWISVPTDGDTAYAIMKLKDPDHDK